MSARDNYSHNLKCSNCDAVGSISLSEEERPSVYTGIGRRVDGISPEFTAEMSNDRFQKVTVTCKSCKVEVPF